MGKVLSAQGSGYFPTCILQGELPFDYPSGSLQDIMTFYWRIKKFNVTISGSGTSTLGQGSVVMSGSFPVINNYQNIDSESELVCNLPNIYFGTGGQLVVGGTTQSGLFAALFHIPEYYQKSGSPNIQTNLRLSGGATFNYFFDLIPFTNRPPTPVGSWSINFYGGSLSGKLYAPGTLSDDSDFRMTFNTTEYWSYGGTYNTSTGEPL